MASVQRGKGVDWAVIDHMPQGITSSTDPKVANVVGMSPSMTEITLGFQTMMCRMAWRCFSAGRTNMHGAEESVMTKIQANITTGAGGAGAGVLDQDSRGRRGDPLAFSDLDSDDIVGVY